MDRLSLSLSLSVTVCGSFLGTLILLLHLQSTTDPLLVYLAWSAIIHSLRSKLHALGRAPHRICLCMIGREGEGHVRCVSAGIMWCALPPASIIVAARPVFVDKNCK